MNNMTYVIDTEEWPPPYIKPKPVYDDGSPIGKDNGQMLDARWVLPFIFGLIIGFGICLTIF